MPRLVGQKSDNSWVPGLLLVAVVGVTGYLEYFGFIDVVPNFGAQRNYVSNVHPSNDSNLSINTQK
jgi:hypothetical protein